MDIETLDLERQKEAKEYARISRRLMLLDLALGAIYVIFWLVSGAARGLKTFLIGYITNDWLLVAAFAAVFGGIYLVINLPLAFYEGYALPHRFGMSNQSLNTWISDQVKEWVLSAILGGLLLEVIYAVLRAAPETWWLWAGGILLLFSVLLANLAPVLLFPLFNKYTPLGEEHAELIERLTLLAQNAGTQVQGVYQFDMSKRTKAANAALAGLGNTRRIILGDTLLKEFTPDEIETVIAHELGHHVNKDIPLMILVQSAVTMAGLYLASLGLRWGSAVFSFQGPADIAALPLFVLVISLYGLVTMPLTNGFSRWCERRADDYALRATRRPAAFASAMTRIANQNLSEVDPEPWVEWLLYSHPALDKRIERAQKW